MPGRAIGVQWFSIDRKAHTLALDMTLPALQRPNTTLRVPIKIDGLGSSDQARVVVATVDVGILNLTNYKPPAPDEFYLGQRQLSAELRDLYGQLIDGMQGTRGQIRTGGDAGAELNGSPPTQAPLAFFSGIVEVRSGQAEVAFDIPAFAGTVRVMAVAWSKDKVGRASGDVTVRDPVVLTATLPRFLLTGDKSSMNLDLDNVEGGAGAYSLTVTAEGPVAIGEGAAKSLQLRAKQRDRVVVPLNASGAGAATVKVAIKGPGDFALERSYVMNVKPATQVLARRTVKPIAKGESLTLSSDLFADLVPGTGNVSVSVGVSTALDAASLLKALDRYPYGCSEQITSRAMPLLYVNELASAAHLALDDAIDQRIRDAIDRVLARQSSNGSFGLWGVGGDDAWLDAYVTDFLTRAKERGFAVPDTAFKLALDRLRNIVGTAADASKDGGRNLAYALYVLARNGTAPLGDLRYLADAKLDDLGTPIAKAQIAAALGLLGDRTRAERVYKAALDDLKPPAQRELFSREDYGSTLRDAAALVTLASEAGGSRPMIVNAVAKIEAGEGARALHLDAGERVARDGRARDGEGLRRRLAQCRGRQRQRRALPQRQGERTRRATEGDQHRRRCVAGRGVGLRRANRAGARGGKRLQDRAALLHARWRRRRSDQGQAEPALRGGAEDHRARGAVRPRAGRRLSAGGLRDRQPAAGLVGRDRHAVVDRERQGAGVFGVPRRTVQRGVRAAAEGPAGVCGGLCGARGVAGPLRAAAGLCRGHVPAGPLRADRHRHHRDRAEVTR